MPARTTRQQARERLIQTFMASLDKVIPPDEAVPLRGSTFRDWEDQAAELRRAGGPPLLEGRAAPGGNAPGAAGGPSPPRGPGAGHPRKRPGGPPPGGAPPGGPGGGGE